MTSINGTGTLAINSEQILNTTAVLNKAFTEAGVTPPADLVDDSSLENLQICFDGFKESTENIAGAIVGFNQYLDSMANAFKEKDSQLAIGISSLNIKKTFNETNYMKDSAYTDSKYRDLPGAD